MRILLTVLFFINLVTSPFAQDLKKGTLVTQKFLAPSIQGNAGGENPLRNLTIYLPSGYEQGTKRYPVIYFLHAFLLNDSLMMVYNQLKSLMDSAIISGELPPMILVMPDSETSYGGSWYTNSTLTGNWADYIGKDVVSYMDKSFRTINDRNSRGLAGHSMGGYGALKIGMLFPEVFGAVYSLSPATIGWGAEFDLKVPIFKNMSNFKNEFSAEQITDDMIRGRPEFPPRFQAKLMADLARTYSPAPGKNFISADMPVTYVGDSMIVNKEVREKWEANFPLNMIDTHLQALKSLNALKIDWGRNDEGKHIPATCIEFCKKLDANHINYFSEEYNGRHINKLAGTYGRYYMDMFPFFKKFLKSEIP
ncbi:MAG: alpha/beta hydrolase-fold protein [Chitinophagaceae bacterium]